jgi:sugar O-acyltransferase (sialic acid O-acetyltransferase NeuD family)
MDEIIIIGGGGHAKVIISIIKRDYSRQFKIIGYTDFESKNELLGVKYLGFDSSIDSFLLKANNTLNAIIGIGFIKPSASRTVLYNSYKKKLNFPSIISANSSINEDCSIGNGTVIMDGVVINSSTRIGECSIINTSTSIDHDCEIGDFTHIAPGCTLSGGVKIGNNCMVGVGTTIIQGISIVENVTIGAASLVSKSITLPGTYVGFPLRKIK